MNTKVPRLEMKENLIKISGMPEAGQELAFTSWLLVLNPNPQSLQIKSRIFRWTDLKCLVYAPLQVEMWGQWGHWKLQGERWLDNARELWQNLTLSTSRARAFCVLSWIVSAWRLFHKLDMSRILIGPRRYAPSRGYQDSPSCSTVFHKCRTQIFPSAFNKIWVNDMQ